MLMATGAFYSTDKKMLVLINSTCPKRSTWIGKSDYIFKVETALNIITKHVETVNLAELFSTRQYHKNQFIMIEQL